MNDLEIITTSDGSHTIRDNRLNETYHSVHGAVQESMHVFIRNGLSYFQRVTGKTHLYILEVGFGTGLNAWLTLQYGNENGLAIHYTSLEPFPLEEHVWLRLNYGVSDRHAFEHLHQAAWDREVAITPQFTLLKKRVSLQEAELGGRYDLVYFDAFAPSIQPELWQYASLQKVINRISEGGVFVTYSAKGQLKRDLKALELQVETLPGPPGKMQMVRALKQP